MPKEVNPLLSFKFALEMAGQIKGFFTEVSGIGSENDVIDHKVVTETGKEIIHKIPGRLKWTDITLKRGITDSKDVWIWRDQVIQGKIDDARKNVSIIMMNRKDDPVARWDMTNAWPSKVTGPGLKSDSNEIGIEEMVIVHEGIIRSK